MSHAVAKLCAVSTIAFLLAACGARAHCAGERAYQSAESVDALRNVEGVAVPRSSSEMVIPDEPASGPAYATDYTDDDGKARIRCLDAPPRLQISGGSAGSDAPDANADTDTDTDSGA